MPILVCVTSSALLLAFAESANQDQTAPARKSASPPSKAIERPRVLVFSKTAGFRHGSIPTGIKAMVELGKQHGFEVITTEDPTRFNEQELANLSCVVFLNTTGDVLDDAQQKHFENVHSKAAGVTSASTAPPTPSTTGPGTADWSAPGSRRIRASSPPRSTSKIELSRDQDAPAVWDRTDEWYVYRDNPRPNVKVSDEPRRDELRGRWHGRRPPHRAGTTTSTAGVPSTPAADIPTSRTPSRSSDSISPARSCGRPGMLPTHPRRRSPTTPRPATTVQPYDFEGLKTVQTGSRHTMKHRSLTITCGIVVALTVIGLMFFRGPSQRDARRQRKPSQHRAASTRAIERAPRTRRTALDVGDRDRLLLAAPRRRMVIPSSPLGANVSTRR